MTERGMTPLAALQSATVVAAELIRADKLEQLKPGWHTDIIALDANPMDHIATLRTVTFVMKAGRAYKGGE